MPTCIADKGVASVLLGESQCPNIYVLLSFALVKYTGHVQKTTADSTDYAHEALQAVWVLLCVWKRQDLLWKQDSRLPPFLTVLRGEISLGGGVAKG